MARIIREGDFGGPNFVRGLANQKQPIEIVSETVATLGPFEGGFDPTSSVTMVIFGTGFGLTDEGRYTGRVSSFIATDNLGNSWHVTDYGPTLNTLATASIENTFVENLLGPTQWNYFGNDTPDVFIGAPFADQLRGFGGNDSFEGLGGDDFIWGGKGQDDLNGQQGADTIYGGPGKDQINGGKGADQIFGNKGHDTITGGDGADTIRGGKGDDEIRGNAGADTISGGKGADQIFGGTGEDEIRGNDNNDRLFGQNGTDTIYGGRGADFIDGGNGVDFVIGGGGDDVVQGGAAADFILGGHGDDTLSGNTANTVSFDGAPDTFLFKGCFGDDTITDFEIGWDAIFMLDFDPADVKVVTRGSDVRITAETPDGQQTILVKDVADTFNEDSDIAFVDSSFLDDLL